MSLDPERSVLTPAARPLRDPAKMTLTQVLLLLLVLLLVAIIAFKLGRNTTDASPPRSSDTAGQMPTPIAAPAPPVQTTTATPPRAQASAAPPTAARATKPGSALPAIHSWGYQLQNLNIAQASESPYDLLVIDYAKDGSDESALTRAEVTRLQHKPDGSRRLVLAYLSVGEAESYRGYWDARWKTHKPSWLLAENPEWEENYAVCFWDPGWQAIMCGSPSARLDRILAAGFDGVYLDKCDVYEDMRQRRMPEANTRPDLEADMVAFVQRLSGYAKAKQPGFLVVMQNAEGLLDRPELRRALDGSAKEELIFGVDGPEKRNSADDINFSSQQFKLMTKDGKFVLVVEYLNNPAKIEDALRTIQPLGFPVYIAPKDRDLKKLNLPAAIA
jgi:cysteinyl-tRNA synthetase, unknown class